MSQEPKTKMTDASVFDFITGIEDSQQQKDSETLVALFEEITGEPPRMWGSSMVGFGAYHYKYASGHEGDAMMVGFSPRKGKTTLYLSYEVEAYKSLLDQLGPHKTGKGCLYIKRLDDVDMDILKKILESAYSDMQSYKKTHA